MKSTIDKLDGLSRKLNVEIPLEKVQEAFDRVYKAIQKNANIKGFRQGKAPLATIRKLYADKVKSDVVNDLINEAYGHALEEHKIDPVGYPQVAFQAVDEDKAFQFSAEFEIRPHIELRDYENLKVVKEKVEVGPARIDEVIENIRKGHVEHVTVFEDRALGEGDVADLDFSATVAGQPLPGGSAEGHLLEIGSKQFIEGFEDGLLGMKPGDRRTLNLRFPADYHEKTIAGQPVVFEVKLNAIKRKSLPEINDELAKKVGPFQSMDELKDRIRQDLHANEERRVNEDLKNRVIRALVEANPVETPKGLVDRQKQSMVEDFKRRLKQQGLSDADFDEYQKSQAVDFASSAEFLVKSSFLIEALAEKLSLSASRAEVDARIVQYAKQSGIEPAKVQEFYSKSEPRARLAMQICEEKVVDHLISRAQVTEVAKDQLPKDLD